MEESREWRKAIGHIPRCECGKENLAVRHDFTTWPHKVPGTYSKCNGLPSEVILTWFLRSHGMDVRQDWVDMQLSRIP
jgi:hypothetical protein